MSRKERFWYSFVIGWSIKLIPLAIHALFENQITVIFAGIANIDFVIAGLLAPKLGGIGLLGYNESGKPMYEGTPILIPILFVGFLSGLIIYPLIIFLILTIWQKFKITKSHNLTQS